MEHYFTNSDTLKSEIKEFKVKIKDNIFTFKTDNGVFSKGELDYGTYLLISNVLKFDIKGDVLDLGCGYGAIGIIVAKLKSAKVFMIDVNKRALHLTKMNAKENEVQVEALENDGLDGITNNFDYIITNPPIRVGKTKLYELLNDAIDHLKKDGVLFLVIRKEQGAKSFIKDFSEKAQINILDKSKGFYILSLKCQENKKI